jgi:hypothetical protein
METKGRKGPDIFHGDAHFLPRKERRLPSRFQAQG